MASIDYNPTITGISFSFICPECGADVSTDILPVPSPNLNADNQEESMNSEEESVICDECSHEFSVSLNTGMYGGELIIDDVDELSDIEFVEEDEYTDEEE